MIHSVHPATISLRGDDRYNARITQIDYRLDGASIITGLMKADSPRGVEANPPLPDVPFRYTIPADATPADYRLINVETFRRLRDNEPLWSLDFAPPLPPQPHNNTHAAAGLLIAGLALAVCLLPSRSSHA
jgi:hypothetical protein